MNALKFQSHLVLPWRLACFFLSRLASVAALCRFQLHSAIRPNQFDEEQHALQSACSVPKPLRVFGMHMGALTIDIHSLLRAGSLAEEQFFFQFEQSCFTCARCLAWNFATLEDNFSYASRSHTASPHLELRDVKRKHRGSSECEGCVNGYRSINPCNQSNQSLTTQSITQITPSACQSLCQSITREIIRAILLDRKHRILLLCLGKRLALVVESCPLQPDDRSLTVYVRMCLSCYSIFVRVHSRSGKCPVVFHFVLVWFFSRLGCLVFCLLLCFLLSF